MKYFAIETSLNEKILGKYPPVKGFIHHCNVDEEQNFIDKFIFEKIEVQPILSNVVLYANAKQTDLIDVLGSVGFNFGYLISDKFKQILDQFNCYGFQFFKTSIFQNDTQFNNYWQAKIYDFPYQYINFSKTNISIKNTLTREIVKESIKINDIKDFQKKIETLEFPLSIFISNISFIDGMDLDFFNIRFFRDGGFKGMVSERLKNELEKHKITGIEFRPIEISFQDWVKRDGPRDQIYGRSW